MPQEVNADNGIFRQLVVTGGPRTIVTQQTNINTAVDMEGSLSATITTVDPAIAAAGEQEFAVTNTIVGPFDTIIPTIVSGPSDNEQVFVDVTSITPGTGFTLCISNHGGAQGDGAMVINVLIIKG